MPGYVSSEGFPEGRGKSTSRGSRKQDGERIGEVGGASGGAWGGGLNQSRIQEHQWNTPGQLTFPRLTPLPSKRSRGKIEPKRKPYSSLLLWRRFSFFLLLLLGRSGSIWCHCLIWEALACSRRGSGSRWECAGVIRPGLKKWPFYNRIGLDSKTKKPNNGA